MVQVSIGLQMETCTKVSTKMDSLTERVNTCIATVLFTKVTLRII